MLCSLLPVLASSLQVTGHLTQIWREIYAMKDVTAWIDLWIGIATLYHLIYGGGLSYIQTQTAESSGTLYNGQSLLNFEQLLLLIYWEC